MFSATKKWQSFYVGQYYKLQTRSRKFCKKDFSKTVGENYSAGIIAGIEKCLELVKNPEDRGELHKAIVDAQNDFHNNGLYKLKKRTLGEMIERYEC